MISFSLSQSLFTSTKLIGANDTLGPIADCSDLAMVRIKIAAAVAASRSTEMLETIPGTLISMEVRVRLLVITRESR